MLSAHGTRPAWGGLWGEQRNADFLGVCFCFPKQPSDSDFSSHSCNSANNNTSSVEAIKASIFVPLAEPIQAQMNLCTQQPARSLNQRPCAGPQAPPRPRHSILLPNGLAELREAPRQIRFCLNQHR